MSDKADDGRELEMIRKLMILGLVKLGVTQDEIGAGLGMHRTTLARMFPKGLLSDISKRG